MQYILDLFFFFFKFAHANSHRILLENFSIPILLKQATLVKAGIPPQYGIHLAFVTQS